MRAELMLLWGVGRTRAVVLSNGDDFPRPVSRVMAGSIWDLAEVLEWSAQKNRPVHLDALDAAAVAVDEG